MPLPDCACGGYPYFRSRYPGFEAECKDCGQHIRGDTKNEILTKWNSPLSIQHLSTTNEKTEMTSPEPRNYSEIVYADMTATADSLAFNAAMDTINEAIVANHCEYYYFCDPSVDEYQDLDRIHAVMKSFAGDKFTVSEIYPENHIHEDGTQLAHRSFSFSFEPFPPYIPPLA